MGGMVSGLLTQISTSESGRLQRNTSANDVKTKVCPGMRRKAQNQPIKKAVGTE